MTSKSPLSVICDAGPLIHLDELNSTSLLNDFHQVIVPDQVWREVQLHRPSIWEQPDFNYQKIVIIISSDSTFQALVRMFSLDLGEQAALSLMQQYPQAIFVTDDAAARLAANTLGLRVHGTIGILLRAIRRQQLTHSEVLEILGNLTSQSTLHIKASLLQEIIDRL
ncbi:MAG: DNA-binding protein [Xenococcus sp. (in: cyanobacteria)]